MYRKLLIILGFAAVLSVGILNANLNFRDRKMSDLTLANIEALALNESGGTKCTVIGYE